VATAAGQVEQQSDETHGLDRQAAWGITEQPPVAAQDNDSSAISLRRAPIIDSAEPLGDGAAVSAAIVVTFSQPMTRSSVEQAFAIRPLVDGRLTWGDDLTLRFQPFLLAHSVTYEVSVGGRSIHGKRLAGQTAWRFTTAGGPPIALQPGPGSIRVPILMYHYIRVNPDPYDRLGFALSVTPSDFAAQMDWLAQNGYHPITFADLNAYLSGAQGLPSRPIILTFDDGYADFYYAALPVLRSHDFRAVAYVVSGFLGWPGYMSSAQVAEANRMGIEIGSHTVDHVNLTRQSVASLRYELAASKQTLELLLGHPVLSFCYPSGRFNPWVVSAVEAAGYQDATTTQFGSVRTLGGRYLWGRLRVSGGENLQQFAAAVLAAS
jgi:peptidoglycan/xylan/chitin deacetylase (PgdA/CDA1 family)